MQEDQKFEKAVSQVVSPDHYHQDGHDAIEIIDDILTRAKIPAKQAYAAGNILKYALRANSKGSYNDDVMKAANYLHKLVTDQWLEVTVEINSQQKDDFNELFDNALAQLSQTKESIAQQTNKIKKELKRISEQRSKEKPIKTIKTNKKTVSKKTPQKKTTKKATKKK